MTTQQYAKSQASKALDSAKEVAESAGAAARVVRDTTTKKFDELSRFGRERPLLSMIIAFGAGYMCAKIFGR